jgi:alpha-tubulin suppressor-like RCC1 family protein
MKKPVKECQPSMAMVFGRNYYHALGGGGGLTNRSAKNSVSAAAFPSSSTLRKLESMTTLVFDGDEDSRTTQIAASAQSTVFLTSSGRVYQTGTLHGHVIPFPTRVAIPLPIPAVQVSCGRHFCLALMQGGVVVSWGAGHFGQLGIGATAEGGGLDASDHAAAASLTFASTPVVIERLLPHIIGSAVVKVSAGDWHALAMTQSGRVWAWGSNRSYQCGRKPASSNTTAPTLTAPLPVPMDGTVVDIAAGRSHSVALLSPLSSASSYSSSTTGQVLAWGASHYGQCGVLRRAGSGVVPPRLVEGLSEVAIESISAAGNHTLALTTGGRVFGWGSASEGEVGLGTLAAKVTNLDDHFESFSNLNCVVLHVSLV